jgi:hypothetical protein
MTSTPTTPSHLLSLPGELRSFIWHYTFCSPDPITISLSPARTRHASHPLNALLTCRMIHAEAYHLYYTRNHLRLPSIAALFYFLSDISPLRRACIRSLIVSNVSEHWTSMDLAQQAFALLATLPELKELGFEFEAETNTDPLNTELSTAFWVLGNCVRGLETCWMRQVEFSPMQSRLYSIGDPLALNLVPQMIDIEDSEYLDSIRKMLFRKRGKRESKYFREAFGRIRARGRERAGWAVIWADATEGLEMTEGQETTIVDNDYTSNNDNNVNEQSIHSGEDENQISDISSMPESTPSDHNSVIESDSESDSSSTHTSRSSRTDSVHHSRSASTSSTSSLISLSQVPPSVPPPLNHRTRPPPTRPNHRSSHRRHNHSRNRSINSNNYHRHRRHARRHLPLLSSPPFFQPWPHSQPPSPPRRPSRGNPIEDPFDPLDQTPSYRYNLYGFRKWEWTWMRPKELQRSADAVAKLTRKRGRSRAKSLDAEMRRFGIAADTGASGGGKWRLDMRERMREWAAGDSIDDGGGSSHVGGRTRQWVESLEDDDDSLPDW